MAQQNAYRASSAPPVQPYAFQNTPHLRQHSQGGAPPKVAANGGVAPSKPIGHAPSPSTSSSDTSSVPSLKDDSVIGSRAGSVINLSSQLPDLSFTPFDAQPPKASPDRYRRPQQKRTDSSNTATPKATSPQLSPITFSNASMPNVSQFYEAEASMQRQESVDDLAMPKKESDLAKRYRRRSLNTLETQHLVAPQATAGVPRPSSGHGTSATSTPTTIRPVPFHSNSSKEDGIERIGNGSHSSLQKVDLAVDTLRPQETAKLDPPKAVTVPPRGSSEASKRLAAPSPLSKQAFDSEQSPSATTPPAKARTYAAVAQAAVPTPSPAAAQLAAVSDKDLNKGMKSRLRRAFSFGGSQELRRAAGENSQAANQQAQQAKEQHQQTIDDELDAEQQEIARRQEAAGIGAGIYSGQGGFSGSTDNLSISSTASSASMMLRKMGRGAKKGARSIKGLFRPKSVIGVPAADGPIQVGASTPTVQPSVAQVSMVTVEAERLKVNVNADPSEHVGGGTGFPRLERNSLDAARLGAAGSDTRGSADTGDSHSRRSIVGSDKDRAEVLAAVRKGILKRSGTASPSGSPVIHPTDGVTPVPQVTESPASSMPSTPKDGAAGGQQRRSISLNGDYFSSRLQGATNLSAAKSMPNTPNGSVRSISFSPRIQFHDVWSSSEYDRRGDIATCNRLTPMLAQQIKEELNTFKMEMEVHELSKPHTHFF
ncbi:MAG: hypothetical protein FE78DRAFT_148151 [Acidomyces sp. 'richmondensis']|nr:MAG: hypothetical protein FE78DRAFT_148151 [Acidomyces sp. 'richmondensis']